MVAPQKLARNPFFAGLTAEDRELLSPITHPVVTESLESNDST